MMRHVVLAIGLAGCSPSMDGAMCTDDSQCGSELCARDGICTPASGVRQVTVTWTVRGAPADSVSCAAAPDLLLEFDGPSLEDQLEFAPVPCRQGRFNIDKLPLRYLQVEIGPQSGLLDAAPIDTTTNTVAFDLIL
jgi:hypothetical protein